jgi:hypothetical protein
LSTYRIKKIPNDGHHLRDEKAVINFITAKGVRRPKEIWVGYSSSDFELTDITKKGLISKLERDDRFFLSEGKECVANDTPTDKSDKK